MCQHLTRCLWLRGQLLQVSTPDYYRLIKDYVEAMAGDLPVAEADPESTAGRRLVRT